MKVRDLMTRDVAILPRTATVAQAIAVMEARRASSVLIEREGEDEPWGIVSRSDVVHRVAARGLDPARVAVTEVMSAALLAVDPALDVGYASRLMRRFRVRHLPVFEGTALVGIISFNDVLRIFRLLSDIPFFRKLPLEDLMALLQIASVRICADGEILVREGEEGRELFLLEEGAMSVSTKQAGRIARIRAHELFGEMELFGGRRSATVRSAGVSRVLAFDAERLVALLATRERLGAVVFESMARILSDRLRRANRFLFVRGLWTHRALVLRATGVVATVFLAAVLGLAGASESPSFCNACHYMRPYQASWRASPHRDVACTKCHEAYGWQGAWRGKITGLAMVVRYATKTYAPRPEAKVEDASCRRSGCHATESRAWLFRAAGGGGARFDHALHERPIQGFGTLRCTSCHAHREGEEHFAVAASTCFLCHLGGTEAPPTPCRGCHDFGPVTAAGGADPARVQHAALGAATDCLSCHRNVGAGAVPVDRTRCASCHLETGPLAEEQMHRVHVLENGADCFDCHADVKHPGPSDRILAGRCEACHGGMHEAQERLYLGEGGEGVPRRPALMFYYHVECTACHEPGGAGPVPGTGAPHGIAAGSACLDCHDKTLEDRARMWRVTIERSRARVASSLSRFATLAGPDGAARHPEAFRLYEEARHNFQVVAADPSAGIHNFRYAEDLLKASEERIREALDLLSAREGDGR